MPYPISPFRENFDYKLITNLLADQSDTTILNEDLFKLLKWLCTSPKVTSFRVNNLKTNNKDVLAVVRSQYKLDILITYIDSILINTIIIENSDESTKCCKRHEKEIVIDSDCGSSILRGSHIYAPGVLGMVSGCQPNDYVSIYVDVAKKCKKGLQKIYENDLKVYVGNGRIKMQRHQLFSDSKILPKGIAVEVIETISGCPVISENILPPGHVLLQNLPSILCVQTLNPKPGDEVIDMCASPGNKTTHLADLMNNQGILVAIDKTAKKVNQLQVRCNDFGAKVYAFQADSTAIFADCLDKKSVVDGPPFSSNSFDKILLDAPCSVLGKRPQFVNKMSVNEIKSYVPLQRKLFENAVNLLKPGGTMVYSTCTITLAENEGIIAWALSRFDCLELVKPSVCLGETGWVGTSLTDEDRSMVQRFGPNAAIDSVGFFFAYLRKKINSSSFTCHDI